MENIIIALADYLVANLLNAEINYKLNTLTNAQSSGKKTLLNSTV